MNKMSIYSLEKMQFKKILSRVKRVMEADLSSGEDSDEDETPPEGFNEEIHKLIGWVDVEDAGTIPPITIRDIHSYFIQ